MSRPDQIKTLSDSLVPLLVAAGGPHTLTVRAAAQIAIVAIMKSIHDLAR